MLKKTLLVMSLIAAVHMHGMELSDSQIDEMQEHVVVSSNETTTNHEVAVCSTPKTVCWLGLNSSDINVRLKNIWSSILAVTVNMNPKLSDVAILPGKFVDLLDKTGFGRE